MSGFVITMMMHLFFFLKNALSCIGILFNNNIFCTFGHQGRAAAMLLNRKLRDSWRKDSEAEDRRFPKEVPHGQVPSDEKKCFS